jgi:membrane-associated phospholipid phosphatase
MRTADLLAAVRRRPYAATFAVTAVLCLVSILIVDRAVTDWAMTLQASTRSAFSEIARLSAPEVWIPLSVAGAVICYALDRLGVSGMKRAFHAFAFVAAATIVAGGLLNVAKFVFGRLRPKAYLADGSYGFDPFSFDYAMNALPSGHTQAAVTFAVALILIAPRYDLAFAAFGVLIAAARVIHTNHWVADVIAGAWLGAVVPVAIAVWMAQNGRSVRLLDGDGPLVRWARRALTEPPIDRRDAREIAADRLSRP